MVWFGLVWFCGLLVVWYWGGGLWGVSQMTSEFIHEEISIMDYNGLSFNYHRGGEGCSRLACMTGMDE